MEALISRAGYEWSAIVNELEWGGHALTYTAIEAQLPERYSESDGQFEVSLDETDAEIFRQIEGELDWAEYEIVRQS